MTIVMGAILICAVLFVVVIGSLIFYFIKKDQSEEDKTFIYGTDGDDDSDDFINQLKNGL